VHQPEPVRLEPLEEPAEEAHAEKIRGAEGQRGRIQTVECRTTEGQEEKDWITSPWLG